MMLLLSWIMLLFVLQTFATMEFLCPSECVDDYVALNACMQPWGHDDCTWVTGEMCNNELWAIGWDASGCPDNINFCGDICKHNCGDCPPVAQITRDEPRWMTAANENNEISISVILVAYSDLDLNAVDTSLIINKMTHPVIEQYFQDMDFTGKNIQINYNVLGVVHSEMQESYPTEMPGTFLDPNQHIHDEVFYCSSFYDNFLQTSGIQKELDGLTDLVGWNPESDLVTMFVPILTKCVDGAAWFSPSILYAGQPRPISAMYMAYNAPASNGGTHGEYNPGMPYESRPGSDFVHPLYGSDRVLLHELLHAFGVQWHADRMNCADSNCGGTEYGNTMSAIGTGMGYGMELDPNERYKLGFMNAEDFVFVTGDGSYSIAPLEKAINVDPAMKRAAVIVGQTHSFFVEYRRPAGYDTIIDKSPELELENNMNGIIITEGNRIIPAAGMNHVDGDGKTVWFSLNAGMELFLWDTGIVLKNVQPNGDNGVTFEVQYTACHQIGGCPEQISTMAPPSTEAATTLAATAEPGTTEVENIMDQMEASEFAQESTAFSTTTTESAGTWETSSPDMESTAWSTGSSDMESTSWSTGSSEMESTAWSTGSSEMESTSWSTGSSDMESTSGSTGSSDMESTAWSTESSDMWSNMWSTGSPDMESSFSPDTSSSITEMPVSSEISDATAAPSTGDCEPLEMMMTTKSWGNEVSWFMGHCSGGSYVNDDFYIIDCCLPFGEHELTCTDSYGDGWNGGHITINGQQYCGDFDQGSEKKVTVNVGPTTTKDLSSCNMVPISVTTKNWGNEMTWSIEEMCVGNAYESHKMYTITDCCIPDGTYELSCVDSYGDGWNGGYIEIDAQKYCEDFENGPKTTRSVTIGASKMETEISSKFSLDINPEWLPLIAVFSGSLNLILAGLLFMYCARRFCSCSRSKREQEQKYALLDDDEV